MLPLHVSTLQSLPLDLPPPPPLTVRFNGEVIMNCLSSLGTLHLAVLQGSGTAAKAAPEWREEAASHLITDDRQSHAAQIISLELLLGCG